MIFEVLLISVVCGIGVTLVLFGVACITYIIMDRLS